MHIKACAILVEFSVLAASADTAYLESEPRGQATPFNSSSGWNPAVDPGSDAGRNTDYVVGSGKKLFIPQIGGMQTFAGKSLSIGAPDFSSRGTIIKEANADLTYIGDFRLYDGDWGYWGPVAWFTLQGAITVHGTTEKPFNFYTKAGCTMLLEAPLTGGSEAMLRFLEGDTRIRADNSDYSGGFAITSGTTLYMEYAYPNAIGKRQLDAFNPRSIVFEGGTLRYESPNRNWVAADNRGITVKDGSSGTFFINGFTLWCGWPIVGNGTISKVGSGSFGLQGPCGAHLQLTEGTTYLQTGANVSAAGSYTATDCTVSLCNADVTATLNNATFSNTTLTVPIRVANYAITASPKIRLGGTLDFRTPLKLKLEPDNWQALYLNEQTNLVLFVVDANASRRLAAEDFTIDLSAPYQGLPVEGIVTSVDEETGDQTVALRLRSHIPNRFNYAEMGNATHWWNQQPLSPDLDYLATSVTPNQNMTFRTGGDDARDYTFPGRSLTLFSPNHDLGSFGAVFIDKQAVFRCGDLRAYDNTQIQFAGYWGKPVPQELAGQMQVHTTDAGIFELAGGYVVTVSADISGEGCIRVKDCVTNSFTGANGAYRGSLEVAPGSTTFRVADETNLGGAPAAFLADALSLGAGTVFSPLASLVIDDENRGMTVADNVAFVSDAGVTLQISSPLAFAGGTVEKRGEGTLAIGVKPSLAAATTLNVLGGSVQALVANAFSGMAVRFADGAGLVAGETEADFTETAVTAEGAIRLSLVGIEPGDTDVIVPIAVMDAQSATSLATVLQPARIPHHSARIIVMPDATNPSLAHIGLAITPKGAAIILR